MIIITTIIIIIMIILLLLLLLIIILITMMIIVILIFKIILSVGRKHATSAEGPAEGYTSVNILVCACGGTCGGIYPKAPSVPLP